ncbi:cytochrome p450 domain-containing protein [Sarocladium implicatum]|nr:cytochrome p450 domain-containing protein [Sarocladium implicatum]
MTIGASNDLVVFVGRSLPALPTHSTLTLAFILSLPVLLTTVYWLLIYPFYVSPLRHLPGPKDNTWFMGQTLKFLEVAWIPHMFREWQAAWPESPFIRYLGLGNTETLVANTLPAYREILSTKNNSFIKPEAARRVANVVIGDGLPFAHGPEHRQRRAVVSKPFTTARVKAFVPTLQSKARQLVNVLSRQRDASHIAEVETPIWKTVLDVGGIEALGVDLNHLESNESQLHELFTQTMQQPLWGHVIHYLSSYLPLRQLLPFDINKDFVRNTSEIRRILWGHVSKRRAEWESGAWPKDKEPDALQCMIEQGTSAWTDAEIVEYLMNLMVLGHDTTACALVMTMYSLAHNPDSQDRLRNEITSLLAETSTPTFEELDRLPFLENFLKEVLRVYCPLQYIPREAIQDVQVAGVFLPKGTIVQLSPGIINLNPAIWGADAESFRPERWEKLEGEAATSAYAFETFHNGTRMCFGRQLAMTEMKSVLVELLSRFHVEALDPGAPLELASPSFTLRPKEKLRVRLTELTSQAAGEKA